MKRSIYQLIFIAISVACLTGCSKTQPETVEEEITVCPFCNTEFASESECLEHQKTCDPYFNNEDELFIIPADSNYPNSTSVDAAHWMSQLPGNTRLTDLTIPGLHDAATYCYNSIITPTGSRTRNLITKMPGIRGRELLTSGSAMTAALSKEVLRTGVNFSTVMLSSE